MSQTVPPTILCLASFEKGFDFLRECHTQGSRVILLTSKSLESVPWPREALEDIFFMPDVEKEWNLSDMINGVSYLARRMDFSRIVALDDFDVEKAALLREHLRVPGMGDSQARFFRDKLAMRMAAEKNGIPVPRFTPTFSHSRVSAFLQDVPAPYLVKPRTQAGAIGIRRCASAQEVWDVLNELGDAQAHYLIEEFVTGDICHVDSIVQNGQVIFASVSRYGKPPLEVYQQGHVFTTRTVIAGSETDSCLRALNAQLLAAFGMDYGVSHTEFIHASDGRYLFLETSARVGGANIAEMVEAATGINLWREWAKMESLADPSEYVVSTARQEYAGLLVSLSKQEWPDMSGYSDPEIWWRMQRHHHAGLIVRSPDANRVEELITSYTGRFYSDFFATMPAQTKATD